MDQTSVLREIETALKTPHSLHIQYQKSDSGSTERHIEPYALKSNPESLLRAYQLEPDEGWRFFVVDKIVAIRRGQPFQPRIKIATENDEAAARASAPTRVLARASSQSMATYRELVLEALADMHVNQVEAMALASFRQTHLITPEQLRGIHYAIFAECLQQIVHDGLITKAEQQQLRELNDCLHLFGAGIFE